MQEIKWIKLALNTFDDEKIQIIETMPEAYGIQLIWIKLLTYAGKSNSNGMLLLNNDIPYTEEMLAGVFRMPLNIVKLALSVFKKFGMIETETTNTGNEYIYLPNWEKHQNIDGMEKIREQARLRMQKLRERQKLLNNNNKLDNNNKSITLDKNNNDVTQQLHNGYNNITHGYATEEENTDNTERTERTERTEKAYKAEKTKYKDNYSCPDAPKNDVIASNDNVITSNGKDKYSCASNEAPLCPYDKILDLYHTLTNLPKVKILSDKRKSYLRSRWKAYPDLNFWQDYFKQVSESLFLTGQVESKNGSPPFQADFEWLITESNFIKVLENKYANKEYKKYKPKTFDEIKQDNTLRAGLNVIEKIRRGEAI